jgi:hypothetical protein
MLSFAAAALLTAATVHADEPRDGMGPGSGTIRRDDSPNPVGSPGRARTSIPGAMEHPNAGYQGPKDASGATESENARLPTGGSAKLSGRGAGVGAP